MLLKGFNAKPLHHVDKTLFGCITVFEVMLNQFFNHVRHVGARERGADHFAQRCVIALRAANRNLIPLFAVFIDAEDADVTDVKIGRASCRERVCAIV